MNRDRLVEGGEPMRQCDDICQTPYRDEQSTVLNRVISHGNKQQLDRP
jgi:hypothetical protein